MMAAITFFVYLDACRYDYISKENTPFLYELSQKGYSGRVRTVAGFTQEVAMMTGKYPDESNYFSWFRYSPSESQFFWVKPIRFLRFLRKSRLYYPVKVGIRTITKMITTQTYPDPSFVPLNILPFFQNLSAIPPKNLPTLFSLCRLGKLECFEQMMIYNFVGTATCGNIFENAIKETTREGRPFDLYLIHIGELDGLGHRWGPHPELFRKHLIVIDNWIRRLYEYAKNKGLNCNMIITSDHGMVDVRGTINLEQLLNQTFLRVPQDYIYFLDSTMAKFWFSSIKAKHLTERILSQIPNGHVLQEKEREKLHINFRDKGYGELLFWVDKGYLIFPNFFQAITSTETKGMHGYMNDEDAALIVYSDERDVNDIIDGNVVPLVKIFDITRNLVGF